MAELTTLRNIGTEMKRKLHTININTAEELKALDSKDVYFRLKSAYPEVCLVHLYSIHGAITDRDYNKLSDETKAALKQFSDDLKQ